MNYELDEKLYELQRACNRYRETDPLADWVLYAIDRHISTGRATPAFIKAFIAYPTEDFPELIAESLNGDRSDNGIIAKVKRIIREEAA